MPVERCKDAAGDGVQVGPADEAASGRIRVGFHRDAATDVTLVHVASPAGEKGAAARAVDALQGVLGRCLAAELVDAGLRSDLGRSFLATRSGFADPGLTSGAASPGGLRSLTLGRSFPLPVRYCWSRPVIARKSAVVLVWGNGSSGTGRSRPAQSGAQPSSGRHSMRRSAGTSARTSALWRS